MSIKETEMVGPFTCPLVGGSYTSSVRLRITTGLGSEGGSKGQKKARISQDGQLNVSLTNLSQHHFPLSYD
jgi:hypothetical protein